MNSYILKVHEDITEVIILGLKQRLQNFKVNSLELGDSIILLLQQL